MSELQALLRRKQREGLSFEQMARNARAAGFPKMAKQYITQVANGEIKKPGLAKLAALAAGMPGVTEAEVKEAAARSQGIHVEHNVPFQVSQLLASVNDLSASNRARWLRLSQAIARELAGEETPPSQRTIIGHEGDKPDLLSGRIVERELDRFEAEDERTQRKRRRG